MQTKQTFLRKRVVGPVLSLLKAGATPERLAWSIAVGIVVGINPLLGSTTVLALAVASALRLNLVASQLGNHLVYPLELLMFPVFIKLGIVLFHTPRFPLTMHEMIRAVKDHPWETTKLLWTWEWHGLLVWLAFAMVLAPLLKIILKPVLNRMLSKTQDNVTV